MGKIRREVGIRCAEGGRRELKVRIRHLPLREIGIDPRSPALAGHVDWWAHVPLVHRALANPLGSEIVPGLPPAEADHRDSLAYWLPVFYVLTYSLGWSHPQRGLKRWFDEGRPEHDDRFALLRQVWDSSDELDYMFAWLFRSGFTFNHDGGFFAATTSFESDPELDPRHTWWRNLQQRDEHPSVRHVSGHAAFPDLNAMSKDPLHLTTHIGAPLVGDGTRQLLISNRKERRATLLLDEMPGWYRQLQDAGAALPPLGDKSWRVDVVCRPVGWLGNFRQSRTTGIWFSGRHRYHEMGVLPPK